MRTRITTMMLRRCPDRHHGRTGLGRRQRGRGIALVDLGRRGRRPQGAQGRLRRQRRKVERHAGRRRWRRRRHADPESTHRRRRPTRRGADQGPTIQEYDESGVVAPYHIDAVAQDENWDGLLSQQVATHMKCDDFSRYCAAPVNITASTGSGPTRRCSMSTASPCPPRGSSSTPPPRS